MTAAVSASNYLAFCFALFGACVCLYYYQKSLHPLREFRLFASIILFYFSIIYLIAIIGGEIIGDTILFQLVRVGILTRLGVMSLIGLLIGWVIAENGVHGG